MRRILYNQSFYNVDLTHLYTVILKTEGIERDIYNLVEFSLNYYNSNLFYPSIDTIKKELPDIELINEKFDGEEDFAIYIRDKEKSYRDEYRKSILINLLNTDDLSIEERLSSLDTLEKLEMELFPSQDTVLDFDDIDFDEKYSNRKLKDQGIMTNIPEIDELTGGITAGKLLVVLAPPKSFKSTFAMNMTYINSLIPDNNTLFITLEIPADELWYKLLVRHSFNTKDNIPILKILKGNLEEKEEETLKNLNKSYKEIRKSKLYVLEQKDLNFSYLVRFKQQLEEIIEGKDIKTVYVDHIHLFESMKTKEFYNKTDFLNAIVGVMREISVSHNVRFIILAQMTKEAIKRSLRTDGMIESTDGADASSLIRDCYYMIGLYSNDELKLSNQLKVSFLLHRDGETFTEPKLTFVIPQKYIVGNIDVDYNDVISMDKVEESNEDTIDIFNDFDDQLDGMF